MAKAIGPQVITVDFKSQDVCKTIQEAVPGGLDGMSSPTFSYLDQRDVNKQSASTLPLSTNPRLSFIKLRRL